MIPGETFNFSISGLLAGIVFSAIGLWLFRQGKERGDLRMVVLSVVMMMYTYFTNSAAADWVLGICLCGLAYIMWT